MRKKVVFFLCVVLLVTSIGLSLTACNKLDCYNKRYYSVEENSTLSIFITKKAIGKPYIMLTQSNGYSRKAKLSSNEKMTGTDENGEEVIYYSLIFTAKWTTIDLKGGSEKNTATENYYYYPDGDYFIVNGMTYRA